MVKRFDEYDPVSMVVWNVGHSQTRKSRLTALAEKVVRPADAIIEERLRHIHEAKV